IVGSGLPVLQVDLEAEHGLDPPDRELEVRTEPGPGVPLTIAVSGEVAVIEVPAHRRDLIEEPGERHLRRGRLGPGGRSEDRDDNDGKDCYGEESSHFLSSERFGETRPSPCAHLTPANGRCRTGTTCTRAFPDGQ